MSMLEESYIETSSPITSWSERRVTSIKYTWLTLDLPNDLSIRLTSISLTETTRISQARHDTPPSIHTSESSKEEGTIFRAGSMCWSISQRDNFHGKVWKDKERKKSIKKSWKKSLPYPSHISLNLCQNSFKTYFHTLEVYILTPIQITIYCSINSNQSQRRTPSMLRRKISIGSESSKNERERVSNKRLRNKKS